MKFIKDVLFVLALCSIITNAFADGCKVDFGDKAFDWVSDDAFRQSRELAEAGYRGRAFNYRLVGYERLHGRIRELETSLDEISNRIKSTDVSNDSELSKAITREQTSKMLLTELYNIKSSLEVISDWNNQFQNETTKGEFDAEGLRTIGRETLLSSIRELGISSAKTLTSRYGFYLQVNFTEDGEPQSGHYKPSGSSSLGSEFMNVGISLILAGEPVGGTILLVGGMILEGDCRDKWKKQLKIFRQAFEALPEKLISDEEQWDKFVSAERAAIARYKVHGEIASETINLISNRWQTLFAANAARAAAARAVIREATVEQIQASVANEISNPELRDAIAISHFANDVKLINADVSMRRANVIRSCRNVKGLKAEEDLLDALSFHDAQFQVLEQQEALNPLRVLLQRSRSQIELAREELVSFGPSAMHRTCNSINELPIHIRLNSDGLSLLDLQSALGALAIDSTILQKSNIKRSILKTHLGVALYCEVSTSGGNPRCVIPGSESSYGDLFSDGANPRSDILYSSGDAGFSNDSRRLSDDVEAASRNIDLRITESRQKVQEAMQVFPTWLSNNKEALAATTERLNNGLAADNENEITFRESSEPLLASLEAKFEAFMRSPLDPSVISDLILSSNVVDVTLPGLVPGSIPPSAPEITGIAASEREFGDTLHSKRVIYREKEKANSQISAFFKVVVA